jgi:hypothetical protein
VKISVVRAQHERTIALSPSLTGVGSKPMFARVAGYPSIAEHLRHVSAISKRKLERYNSFTMNLRKQQSDPNPASNGKTVLHEMHTHIRMLNSDDQDNSAS